MLLFLSFFVSVDRAYAYSGKKEKRSQYTIGIDPGHQSETIDMSALEPNGPGSSVKKAKCTTGTSGRYTGVPEYKLNLDVSLKLKDVLEKMGYNTVMTREDNFTAISNKERALLVAEKGADICIRIHGNGSDDPSVSGALCMIASSSNPYIASLYRDNKKLAENVLDCYCQKTGFSNLGIQTTDSMTGLNWSSVPTIILEMGFMTNKSDDTLMQKKYMQQRMAKGIAKGIDRYFGIDDPLATVSFHKSSENETDFDKESDEADISWLMESEIESELISGLKTAAGKGKDFLSELSYSALQDTEAGAETESEEENNDFLNSPSEESSEKEDFSDINTFDLFLNSEGKSSVLPLGVAGGALLFGENAMAAVQTGMEDRRGTVIHVGGPLTSVLRDYINPRESAGQHWAYVYEEADSGIIYGYNEEETLQSASVIKVFIMAAVYQYILDVQSEDERIPYQEAYPNELRDLISQMITVSDNNCANSLVDKLGEGDFSLGCSRLKQFCEKYGFDRTSMGRRFLESNPQGDNYTSAGDCRKILSMIYSGEMVSESSSAEMLNYLKGQTIRHKIPAGLPSGYICGNKTGDMPEGYGLGCIENDIAIIYPPEGQGKAYILVILSGNLAGDNSGAQAAIVNMSSETARWNSENNK